MVFRLFRVHTFLCLTRWFVNLRWAKQESEGPANKHIWHPASPQSIISRIISVLCVWPARTRQSSTMYEEVYNIPHSSQQFWYFYSNSTRSFLQSKPIEWLRKNRANFTTAVLTHISDRTTGSVIFGFSYVFLVVRHTFPQMGLIGLRLYLFL